MLLLLLAGTSRRAWLACATTAASGTLLPLAALAEVDCMANCKQNCERNAPGSRDYCSQSCLEYCAQGDRRDGLSGSVGSDGAEFGYASNFKLPSSPQKPVVFGQDLPPGLPDLFGTKSLLRKAVSGGGPAAAAGSVQGQGGVR